MVRVLAMPMPSLLAYFGLQFTVFELMYCFRLNAPFRISSVPRGQTLRPAIYAVIEDVVVIDGNGGTAYRVRLSERYEASPYFRQMLHHLSLFWWLPALLVAGGTKYLVFSHTVHRDIAYVVSVFNRLYSRTLYFSIPNRLFSFTLTLLVIFRQHMEMRKRPINIFVQLG
jgi:hypothetical protein